MAPSSLASAPKKRKLTPSAKSSRALASVPALEAALNSLTDLNPLADLVQLALTSADPRTSHKALFAAQRVFANLIVKGRLVGGVAGAKKDAEEVKIVRRWAIERYKEYVLGCGGLLRDAEKGLRSAALTILLSLVSTESSYLSSLSKPPFPQIAIDTFRRFTRAMLLGSPSPRSGSCADAPDASLPLPEDVRDEFLEKWLGKCDDVRYWFLKEATNLLKSFDNAKPSTLPRPAHLTSNLLSLLERLDTLPTEASEINEFWISEFATPLDPETSAAASKKKKKNAGAAAADEGAEDWRDYFDTSSEDEGDDEDKPKKRAPTPRDMHALPAHRALFSACWLTLLRVPGGLAAPEARRALTVMHQLVVPHLRGRERVGLGDWFGDCCDAGGVSALLALNGLWRLMRDHNLDYPDFYKRLYALLDRDVMHVRYRARFFRMLDLFLNSTHLPVALVASFIKRLSRLSISAPPAAVVMIIPFVYNLLKKHPGCMVLIHSTSDAQGADADAFDATETDPNHARALESSIWELASHRRHYNSAVSAMAKVFEEVFTKPNFAMEDFLDHAYSTMFETEAKRKLRNPPALADDLEGEVFGGPVRKRKAAVEAEEDSGALPRDAVAEIFAF